MFSTFTNLGRLPHGQSPRLSAWAITSPVSSKLSNEAATTMRSDVMRAALRLLEERRGTDERAARRFNRRRGKRPQRHLISRRIHRSQAEAETEGPMTRVTLSSPRALRRTSTKIWDYNGGDRWGLDQAERRTRASSGKEDRDLWPDPPLVRQGNARRCAEGYRMYPSGSPRSVLSSDGRW